MSDTLVRPVVPVSKVACLLALITGVLFAQDPPVIRDFYFIDSNEPAIVGQLDAGDRFGRDFNALGDLDLDGVPDFVVGCRSDDDGATDAGALYILFMRSDGSVREFTKISDRSGGLTAAGISLSESQLFGYAVTTVGDLDGDSIQDIAVGARRSGEAADGGAIFILFLNRDGTVRSSQTISNTEGNLGHSLQSSDFFGEGAIGLGTIDGYPTLAVTNSYDDDGGNNRGALYVLRLNPDGTAVTGQTVKISSTSGGSVAGIGTGDRFGGRDVVPLGDIDGDGNLDLAVSAFQADEGRGSIWVLRLNADFTVKAQQKIGQGVGGLQSILNEGDNFGHAAVGPGDLDGDGVPDLITSANKSAVGGTDTGEVYYLFLNPDGTVKSEIRLSEISGLLPFPLPEGGRFGRTLAILGDLANDGTQCLAVGGGAGSTGEITLHFIEPANELLLSDPRAIPSNVLWLDGSDVDGDFVTGGSFLAETQWVDKSSAANGHARQSSIAQRPITTNQLNGLGVVTFDGDDFMDLDPASFGMMRNTAGATVIAVARPTAVPSQGGHRVFMASTGTSSASSRTGFNFFDSFGTGIGGSGDAGLAGRRLDTDPYQRINGGASDLATYSVWVGEFDYAGATARLFQDGALQTEAVGFQSPGNTSDTDSLNIRLGADASLTDRRGFFIGDLAELIVYDRILHPSERKQLEAYLAAKWAPAQLGSSYDGESMTLTWPVTPAPWRLESSANLVEFLPTTITPKQVENQQEVTETAASPAMFYRLTRP